MAYLDHIIDDTHGYNHNNEYWRSYSNHQKSGEHCKTGHDEGANGTRDSLVNDVHILGEPVENTSNWSSVKEGHGRVDNVVKHFVVQRSGGKEGSYGDPKRRQEHKESLNESECGIHTEVAPTVNKATTNKVMSFNSTTTDPRQNDLANHASKILQESCK